jgi:hypothetical protein
MNRTCTYPQTTQFDFHGKQKLNGLGGGEEREVAAPRPPKMVEFGLLQKKGGCYIQRGTFVKENSGFKIRK